MPTIWIPEEELKALQAIFGRQDKVNWDAYDKAKERILLTTEKSSLDAPEPPMTNVTP